MFQCVQFPYAKLVTIKKVGERHNQAMTYSRHCRFEHQPDRHERIALGFEREIYDLVMKEDERRLEMEKGEGRRVFTNLVDSQIMGRIRRQFWIRTDAGFPHVEAQALEV
jgi:hypothetical protein